MQCWATVGEVAIRVTTTDQARPEGERGSGRRPRGFSHQDNYGMLSRVCLQEQGIATR